MQSDLNITASFDRRGKHIYTGNGRGRIMVLDATSLEVCECYILILIAVFFTYVHYII